MLRLLGWAAVVALLAGCQPAPYSGGGYTAPAYSPTHTRVVPPSAQASSGAWYLRCRTDRMSDKKTCSAEINVDYAGASRRTIIVGTLRYDAPDNKISLVVGSYPLIARIRVDEMPPHSFRCVSGICIIQTQPLLSQMQRGSHILLDIQGADAAYPEPQSFSLAGFDEMRQAAVREAARR